MTTIVLKKKDIEDDISEFQPGDEACFKVYTTVKAVGEDDIALNVDYVEVKSHNDEEYGDDDEEDHSYSHEDSGKPMEKPSEGRVIAVMIGRPKK